jgi:ligand-binding sensor domain-containing protein/signal transduction histidine kinase
MLRMVWAKWALCSLWMLGVVLSTHAKDINFEHLSVEKGLSSPSVYAIAQTPDGFLWVGTQIGLNRYDGYGFRVFSFLPGDPASLSNNWVKALLSDHTGTLWVGTSHGLNRYQKESEGFIPYLAGKEDNSSLADNNIWSLFEDAEGVLWVGTNNGLSRYDRAKDTFVSYQIPAPENILGNAINTMVEDRQSNLWVGTWGHGVYRFDRQKGTFTPLTDLIAEPSLATQHVKVLKVDRQGRLWIGTQGTGLHLIDLARRQHTGFRNNENDPSSLSDNYILSLLEDQQGDLWVGTYTKGINLYLPATGTFIRYESDVLVPQSLHGSWITSLFEDSNGQIWAGHDNGLSKFNPQGPRFLHFRNNPYNPNSIPKSNINAIYEDQEGLLWFGMWSAGLSSYDQKTKKFTHYTRSPDRPGSLTNNQVWGICEDAGGSLWVATSGGPHRFDKKTGTFQLFDEGPGKNPRAALKFRNTSSLTTDQKGRLWIGFWGGGLAVYDPATAVTRHFSHDPDNPNSLSNDRVKHLFVDSKLNVWISTSEGGLNKLAFDARGNPQFTRFLYDSQSPWSLGSNSPLVTYEDRLGRIWVGTEGSGLNLFDPAQQEFRRIRLPGVSSLLNSVFGILEDKKGNLWLSTNHGIVSYNPKTWSTRLYDTSDGLQGNSFLAGQCRTRDGQMLFGGHNGFNVFVPEKIQESRFVPPVLINELRLFNEVIEVGKKHSNAFTQEAPLLDQPLYLAKEITLSYKDYVLSFGFASLDYSAPNKNWYAYMLENFEDQWNYTDASKRFATYTNLPPGKYVFKVKGSNSDGVWNEEATAIRVIVTPPFWQTWWFRILAVLAAAAVFYIMHRIRLQVRVENLLAMERVKAQEAENVRKRVAMDFHDEMGNQLASITALINLINIRYSKQDYQIDDLLKKLSQHAQTLFYGTKDFIWSIDPKSDHAEVILMNIRDFGEDLFQGTGIDFHFDNTIAKDHITLPSGYSRHITLICKEVFTNIVKHAGASLVQVRAVAVEDHLVISISDNGRGFDVAGARKLGFGLENMRARARKINGEINIYSRGDPVTRVGTETVLTIHIPKKGDNKIKQEIELYQ